MVGQKYELCGGTILPLNKFHEAKKFDLKIAFIKVIFE